MPASRPELKQRLKRLNGKRRAAVPESHCETHSVLVRVAYFVVTTRTGSMRHINRCRSATPEKFRYNGERRFFGAAPRSGSDEAIQAPRGPIATLISYSRHLDPTLFDSGALLSYLPLPCAQPNCDLARFFDHPKCIQRLLRFLGFFGGAWSSSYGADELGG